MSRLRNLSPLAAVAGLDTIAFGQPLAVERRPKAKRQNPNAAKQAAAKKARKRTKQGRGR